MDTEHAAHHVTSPSVYWKTYGLLLVFMIATVVVAQVPLGPLNNVVALGIAVTKAVLVILFFMQVRYSTRLTWIWAGLGFVWLFLMFATLQDYLTRGWINVRGW